jgi:preprotein translocase subunit SecE
MRDIVGELQKVTWPSREETFRLTGIVLAISLAVGLLLGLLDFGFSRFLGVTIFGG